MRTKTEIIDDLTQNDRERRASNRTFLDRAKELQSELAAVLYAEASASTVEPLQTSTERPAAPPGSDVVGSHSVVRAQTLIFEAGNEKRPSEPATSEDSQKA